MWLLKSEQDVCELLSSSRIRGHLPAPITPIRFL